MDGTREELIRKVLEMSEQERQMVWDAIEQRMVKARTIA